LASAANRGTFITTVVPMKVGTQASIHGLVADGCLDPGLRRDDGKI
jgi:hypothetical protein